jgi:hypothetical protein
MSGHGSPSFADLSAAVGDPRAEPDIDWVSALASAPASAVLQALTDLREHRPELEAIRAAHVAGGRAFYAQIRAPFELYALVRLTRPRHVVEAGVSSGVSSAHFLLGLSDNHRGRLTSIDLPTRQQGSKLGARESPVSLPPERSTGWAVPKRLTRRWTLELGPSESLLPKVVDRLPGIDLFLHDDMHTPSHLAFELRTIAPKLSEHAIVLADNTQWTGRAFDRFATTVGARVLRRRRSDLVGLRIP